MNQVTGPQWLTFDERMKEAASILAAGILRGRKRELREIKRNNSFSANGLDVFAGKSVNCTHKPDPKEERR